MTDYNNDTASVRNSHNIDKRRINSNSNSNNNNMNFQGLRGNHNINVMKADTYNMVLAMLALILVIFSIGSAIWAVDKSKAEVEKYRNEYREDIRDLQTKYDVLENYIIKRG